jgi:hypothetical protein
LAKPGENRDVKHIFVTHNFASRLQAFFNPPPTTPQIEFCVHAYILLLLLLSYVIFVVSVLSNKQLTRRRITIVTAENAGCEEFPTMWIFGSLVVLSSFDDLFTLYLNEQFFISIID